MRTRASGYAVASKTQERPRPVQGIGFDRAVAVASGWLIGGMWLDAWAHHNVPQLETFFTPWHGVLYSGLLAMLAVLLITLVRNHAAGCAWRRALPVGYGLSLAGALVFAVGGAADMMWHTVFGVEADLEALLSPPHLLLGGGAVLMVGGPLRAAWQCSPSQARGNWVALLPMLLSLTFTLSLLTFFTEYANPFSLPWPAPGALALSAAFRGGDAPASAFPDELGQVLGVASILLQTALLMGLVLLAVRRWALPFGALTSIFTLSIGLSVVPHSQYQFIPVALLGGVAADVLLAQLRPTAGRPGAVRLFSFAVPASLFGLYFPVLALTGGISWTVHLWSGTILLAGVVGLLLSYLVMPSASAAHTG
jgi:hypothetical protein